MDRIIKFRAWVTTTENMYGWGHLTNMKEWWKDEAYKLMQFTGLLDKNGKEVYEGDFLRFENIKYDPSEGDTPWLYRPVKFDEYMWKLGDDPLSDWSKEDIEVIGNIYENPDFPTDL